MNILEEIAFRTKERVQKRKKVLSEQEIIQKTKELTIKHNFPFEKALSKKDLSFICEVKKASPSKGIISEHFPYLRIAREYENAGADAISVLTEPYYFQGEDIHLKEIAKSVSIPVMRKDFVVERYMIYEAALFGANAVLLICTLTNQEQLKEYIQIANELGLSALVETHTESEVEMALQAGAKIIGVNNRNLKTFKVDITISERLKPLVPDNIIFVSESGVRTPEDITKLREIGANAVLISEVLMRSPDPAAELARLRGTQIG